MRPRAPMKNGCAKCAIQTQFIALRLCSIQMDAGNKTFSNAVEPSVTISESSWQNDALKSSRPNHQKERPPKFAFRLVVASRVFISGRRPRDAAWVQDRVVYRCRKRNAATHVHTCPRTRNAARAHKHRCRLNSAEGGPLRASTVGFLCIDLGGDPTASGILSRRNGNL